VMPDPIPNPTPDLEAARVAFAAFVAPIPHDANVVALHDSDADGISAGVLWQRGLERLGFTHVRRLLPDRERSAWSEGNRATVAAAKPDRLFVLDLGSQSEPVLPGVPTCFVDHHRPGGVPPGDTLVSAYAWDPIPTTSLLTWELFAPLTDVADLDWVAAIGLLGDLGDSAPFPMLAEAKKRYTAKYLKEAVALLNAARRAARYDPETAARVLLAHADPRALVNSDTADVQTLRDAREEVKAALEEAKKAAPVFSGQVALIRVHSACQIHPLVAQIWRTRLPKFIVLAANDAYLPGRVNFSARAAKGVNVLEFLRSVPLPPGEGSFGQGHDQASGGSLPVARWNALLVALGFPPNVFAQG
jgi:single-stranded-DNA-specific exonuclease